MYRHPSSHQKDKKEPSVPCFFWSSFIRNGTTFHPSGSMLALRKECQICLIASFARKSWEIEDAELGPHLKQYDSL